MQAAKRSWLLGGIGAPAATALARPARVATRLPKGSRLLVVGDYHAEGLTPALRRLCGDAGVVLGVLLLRGDIAPDELAMAVSQQLEATPAAVVLMSWPCSGEVASAVGKAARAVKSSVAWLVSPTGCGAARAGLDKVVPVFRSDVLALPLGPDGRTPTVSGYAGWAAGVWGWLR